MLHCTRHKSSSTQIQNRSSSTDGPIDARALEQLTRRAGDLCPEHSRVGLRELKLQGPECVFLMVGGMSWTFEEGHLPVMAMGLRPRKQEHQTGAGKQVTWQSKSPHPLFQEGLSQTGELVAHSEREALQPRSLEWEPIHLHVKGPGRRAALLSTLDSSVTRRGLSLARGGKSSWGLPHLFSPLSCFVSVVALVTVLHCRLSVPMKRWHMRAGILICSAHLCTPPLTQCLACVAIDRCAQ